MRRRWLLGGFALFVLGAALPAEIRQCLPLRGACPVRAGACPVAKAASSTSCARVPSCPTRGVAPPATADCRLTPTPPLRADAGGPSLSRPAAGAPLLEPAAPPQKIVAAPEPPRRRSRFVSSPARPPEGCRPPPAASSSLV